MNKLSYGLLSLLSTESLSGYDLMCRLSQFWHTNHSAIYPLLSELEEKEYVTYKLIEQNGKPDKKIYRLTDKGYEALLIWIKSKTSKAVVRDEMMLKLFCLQNIDKETVLELLNEMEKRYQDIISQYKEILNKIYQFEDDKLISPQSPNFGAFVLLHKVINDAKSDIEWCNWIRGFYNKI